MFSIVINHYNPTNSDLIKTLTHYTVTNIVNNSHYENEIILVDGGRSNDQLHHYCISKGVRYLPATENENMAQSYNRGISAATRQEIVLIANDIIVPKDWDMRLIEFVQNSPETILIPFLSNSDMLTQIYDYNIVKVKETLAIGMTFNLNYISKDMYSKIGPLDETLSGYFTDTDYFIRAKSKGISTHLVDIGSTTHIGKVTTQIATNTRYQSDQKKFNYKYSVQDYKQALRPVLNFKGKIIIYARKLFRSLYRPIFGRFETWIMKK